MVTFSEILDKLKKISGLPSDLQVGTKVLKMKKDALMQRKLRDSIPHENVINYCLEKGVSLDELYGINKINLYINQKTNKLTETSTNIGDFSAIEMHKNTNEESNEKVVLPFNVQSNAIAYYDSQTNNLLIFYKQEFKEDGIYIIDYKGKTFIKKVKDTFNNSIRFTPFFGDFNESDIMEIDEDRLESIKFIGKVEQVVTIKNAQAIL